MFTKAAPDLFGQGFEAKMKEKAESLKLISAAKTPAGPKKFLRGGRPFAPRDVAAKPALGGETGGTDGPKTNTPRTGSSSPKGTRQRPKRICANAEFVVLSSKLNKIYHGQKGGCIHQRMVCKLG